MSQSRVYIRTAKDIRQLLFENSTSVLEFNSWSEVRDHTRLLLRGSKNLINRVAGIIYRSHPDKLSKNIQTYRTKSLQKLKRILKK